jgi:translation initiation factor IF-3
LSRPQVRSSSEQQIRVNGKIRAREVRVIDADGKQLGIFSLHDAIRLAQSRSVDLVEVAPNANPPVCRLVDYGKYLYEKAKESKEARKHQQANKVKEVQLSPSIDPHDLSIKLSRAVEFLNEGMKVKVLLKYRGREKAHKEIGFQVVEKFIQQIEPYGRPDAPPKLVDKGIVLMLSPLARSKRPKPAATPSDTEAQARSAQPAAQPSEPPAPGPARPAVEPRQQRPAAASENTSGSFINAPFADLDLRLAQSAASQQSSESPETEP